MNEMSRTKILIHGWNGFDVGDDNKNKIMSAKTKRYLFLFERTSSGLIESELRTLIPAFRTKLLQ